VESWQPYFVAQIGASAALTGLVFVALSINLSRIIDAPTLIGRAAEAVLLLVLPMVFGFAVIAPHESLRTTGQWCLAIATVSVVILARLLYRGRGNVEEGTRHYIGRCVVVGVATLPTVVGAVLLITEGSGGLGWLAFAGVTALVAGVSDGWVLLVEILR
jgi:hypothetical protein